MQLEVHGVDCDGGLKSRIQAVSSSIIAKAQAIIADSIRKDVVVQKQAIDEAVSLLYPYKPRAGQQEALHHLIYRRQDLILIAKTSFGKSMILQAVSVLICKSITVVILPLDQIGIGQEAYISRIGGRPCFLNKETINQKVLKQIQAGVFTHILISPELAVCKKFRLTASNPDFKQQLSLVVVDEAHLVSHWGRNSRPAYARLNQLRSLFGSEIPGLHARRYWIEPPLINYRPM